jgi:glucokinase
MKGDKMRKKALAIDIGGTKIAVGLVDEQGGCQYSAQYRTETASTDALFQQICRCIREVVDRSGYSFAELAGIGVGVPGLVDVEKGIALYQTNLPLHQFPLKNKLHAEFSIPVFLDNDVYLAGFGEWNTLTKGEERINHFVFLTVSTGISCCLIDRGVVKRGHGTAGEIGHCILERNGPLCNCGKRGCLEALASGPAITKLARKYKEEECCRLGQDTSPVQTLTAKDVFNDYHLHKPYAVKAVNEAFEHLAYAIHFLFKVYDPEIFVLGGGVLNNNPAMLTLLQEKTKNYLIAGECERVDRLQLSQLNQHAGLIGAGLLVHHQIKS